MQCTALRIYTLYKLYISVWLDDLSSIDKLFCCTDEITWRQGKVIMPNSDSSSPQQRSNIMLFIIFSN